MTNTCDTLEETCACALPGGGAEDGELFLEPFLFQTAAGAGGIGLGGLPAEGGGEVTFSGSLLVDAPCRKLA